MTTSSETRMSAAFPVRTLNGPQEGVTVLDWAGISRAIEAKRRGRGCWW